jgi:hypothetical protein
MVVMPLTADTTVALLGDRSAARMRHFRTVDALMFRAGVLDRRSLASETTAASYDIAPSAGR